MADNPYTPPTLSGYNLNPPPDDGTISAANKLGWNAVHLAKLGDPLKNYADDQNSATLSAFGATINIGPDQNNAMGGSLAFTESEKTIATFTITATRSAHTVDTEGDAPTDELRTINTASVSDGAILTLRAENAGRVVTVKHNYPATGNIFLALGQDIVLDSVEKILTLKRVGLNWYEQTSPSLVLPSLTQTFKSAEQTITVAGGLTLPHGFTGTVDPALIVVDLKLICKVADQGYSVDDIYDYSGGEESGGANSRGIAVFPDATNIGVRYGSDVNVLTILNKTTGAAAGPTLASWRLIVVARL